MSPIKASDIDPQYREQLGLPKARVKRKPVPVRDFVPPPPPTELQVEVQGVRRRLMHAGVVLTERPETMDECIRALRSALRTLVRLRREKDADKR